MHTSQSATPPGQELSELARQAGGHVLSILAQEKTLAGACRAAATWLWWLEKASEQFAPAWEDKPVACAAGCSACCNSMVNVHPLEAILVVVHAQQTLPADRLAQVYDQLRQGALTPCPFLFDDRCSVYQARPSVCRVYYSYDAALCSQGLACERHLDEPAMTRARYPFFAQGYMLKTLETACQTLGLQSEPLLMMTAVKQIFSNPVVIGDWLAGRKPFQPKSAVPAGA